MGANENTQKVLVPTDLVLILRTFISLINKKHFFSGFHSYFLGESIRTLEMPTSAQVSVGDKIDLTVNAIQDKVAH